jgi:hypothetical protein
MKTALVLGSLALLINIAPAGQQLQLTSPGASQFREAMDNVQFILNVLASARVSGSLEYNGKCGPGVLIPDLPRARKPKKPYPQNPGDTLRLMFSDDGRMTVSQEGNGTIRMVEAGIPADILDVRINHLSFEIISDPEEALSIVLGAPEVQPVIQAHGVGQPFNGLTPPLYLFKGLGSPMPGVPPGVRFISGELHDVTVADALDYILKTFPGFWLYQNCQSPDGQRVVHFGLFPVPGKI